MMVFCQVRILIPATKNTIAAGRHRDDINALGVFGSSRRTESERFREGIGRDSILVESSLDLITAGNATKTASKAQNIVKSDTLATPTICSTKRPANALRRPTSNNLGARQ